MIDRGGDPDTSGGLALLDDGSSRTYGELSADVLAAARHLSSSVQRDGLVALCLDDPAATVVALLAVDRLGATALVCDPQWSAAHRETVLRAVRPDTTILTALPRGTSAPGPEASARSAPDPGAPDPSTPGEEPRGAPTAARPDPAARPWAGFSSGSTGRPRAVTRTRRSWTDSFDALSRAIGLRPGDTVLVPGSLASSLTCFAVVHALAEGVTVRVGTRGRHLAAALPDVDLVHCVPSVAQDVLDAIESGVPSRVRTLVVGGASTSPELRSRAARLGVDVVAYYGAVELSFVALDTDGAGLVPFPGVEVEIRPADGASRLGQVWVRSPYVADGYLADAVGPLARDGSWATVGDLAEMPPAPGAPLVLRGRGDGAILTGGSTVVPEDVEVVLRRVPGVRDVVVVGSTHRRLGAVVTAVVEADPRPGLRATLERAARSHLTAQQRPRRWYRTGMLPRTASGKPARAAVSERLQGERPGGDLAPPATQGSARTESTGLEHGFEALR
ncbi:class I adenylate-forming enzyme family protein [Paraoerskovia sediminicola]|uniref:class I adenylate-forming enzyme family protein n=1 Tax=Paraoerskovia sediminicola TaxID=1138587 RepID=UPI00257446C3|nr:class I adenylate-forming enzyme family protein [Paraoerskovia sediminicola]